ncbi:UvrD-helicase domain-containing protein [Hazenella coriacea]|uniref:DNA 3'-5' helicase n=1 Tax=Hazenella coriacea TaxID=1179467 RepID=A0A4R3L149_9BACL|nr:UvrD-helicase domain-containing protein [Hazenella coriacea]TCS93293.1 DNA helicase-2/ATP-dependent DNA helicase PcrA [Hazenella coriacea]
MINVEQNKDNYIDNHVDETISNCMNPDNLRSFFLFAGAGSGKTRSLVTALEKFKENHYKKLQLRGQRVAVITYTNAACEEIESRLGYDPLFSVSTIHTFIWELIKGFNEDIRKWLIEDLKRQIEILKSDQEKGRAGTKTFINREKKIETKENRLLNIKKITQFTYNPNSLNHGKESLNHSEVISIGAYFLTNEPLMQNILISKFPILFVDECQDTNKNLIDALFKVERENQKDFLLGLFGDTMQRIYSDGKANLGTNLPKRWEKPVKKMNHRCSPRIIKLINKIRSTVDNQEQLARSDKNEGFVRLFIHPVTTEKTNVELIARKRMAEITHDPKWIDVDGNYTTLILEHHMAANRLGFSHIFKPLYQIDKLQSGLLDGSLSELKFFTQIILPIVNAHKTGDKFTVASIVRKYSPLIKIQKNEKDQLRLIKKAQEATNQLLSLWDKHNDPRCIDILQSIAEFNLFEIPNNLYSFTLTTRDQYIKEEINENKEKDVATAWDLFLNAPFSQIKAYDSYITGKSNFMTHQGVKGLEFPRVMVTIDDSEAHGKLFSYEKLFGAKEKTKQDILNENTGKETSMDRTRRLFYVTCSRAKESLAIIAYSTDPHSVKRHVLEEGWFEESEVELLQL